MRKILLAITFSLCFCLNPGAMAYLSPLTTIISGQGQFPNGTVGAPAVSFVNSPDAGLYRIGSNDIGMAVAGILGVDYKKSTGAFVNLGFGGAASSSDSFIVLSQRQVDGAALTHQLSQVSSVAQSGAQFETLVDGGSGSCDFGIRSVNSVAPDAYAGGAGIFRCSGGTIPTINLIADDIATATVKIYAGGNTVSDKIAQFHSGGLMLTTTNAQPTCAVGIRGTLYFKRGGAGVADEIDMCMKGSADTYSWVTVKAAP